MTMLAGSWGEYADYVDAYGAAITAKLLALSAPNRRERVRGIA